MEQRTTLCWKCQAEMKEQYEVEILRNEKPAKACSMCGKKRGVYALDAVVIKNKKGE